MKNRSFFQLICHRSDLVKRAAKPDTLIPYTLATPVRQLGIPDNFVEHGSQDNLRLEAGLGRAMIIDVAQSHKGPAASVEVAYSSVAPFAALPD